MAQRSKVGHYEIVAELGRGGMGVVYKGFEASLHRHVAIKMLSEALADDPLVVERFFREARSMAQLNDPHIVQIYFVGEDAGQPYFAMEFVEGESLSQRMKREQRLPPFEAARILLQVAQGLALAHDRGVVHRDIKPANLLITQRGVVKVADFGIALATSDFNKKLTGTGQFVGTPGYLSPEVCLGKPVDQRSDIFALGIVFFEMLTGQTPFKDESPLGMMLEVVQAEIPDVRRINAEVDPRLSEILKRMVAKEPAERYPDCHGLIADLVAAGVNAASPVTPARPHAVAAVPETQVAAPTPPELRRLPTPAPAPAPAPAPGYRTEPSGEQAVMAAAAPAAALPPRPAVVSIRRSSALPWAAAVLALLGSGAGAAWYFNRSPDPASPPVTLASPSPTVASAPAPSPPPATPAAAAGAQSPEPAAAGPVGDAPAASPSSAAADSVASAPAEAPTMPAAAEADAPAIAAEAPAATAGTTVASTAPVAAEADGQAPRASAPALDASPQSAAIGARLADIRERRERREARAQGASPRAQYASVDPAPVAPPRAGPPRVLVVSYGDPAVAGSAELAIEERLGELGLDIVDEDFHAALSGVEDRAADLMRVAATAGNHVEYIVVVRVVPIGEQLLTFYGESMTQYTARVDVAAYDVRARRRMGQGWNAQVSFTHLNADPNTRQAIAPVLGRLAQGFGARGRG